MIGHNEEKKMLIESMKKLTGYPPPHSATLQATLSASRTSSRLCLCMTLTRSSPTSRTRTNVLRILDRPQENLSVVSVRADVRPRKESRRSGESVGTATLLWTSIA
jgi:hypothetical protein